MIDFGLGKLRLWSAAAACAALFMTQAEGAHPAAFRLNDVMQAPSPYDMVAAPTGAAVAWVLTTRLRPTLITPREAQCPRRYGWLPRLAACRIRSARETPLASRPRAA